jgi:thioredoxin-related protein
MKIVRLSAFVSLAAVPALCVVLAFDASVRPARAAEGLWQTDFKAAQAQARAEKKYLLVDFTGSDWCPWCIKLRGEVFDKAPFKAEAPKHYVLVELDFPHDTDLPEKLEEQNDKLAKKYKIKGFPTVLLLDADDRVIARTSYREGGAESYLKHLAELPELAAKVVELKGKLAKAQGLDRAKLLDQIVDGYEKLGDEAKEVEEWSKEIVTLDPDNKAGLKIKYEFSGAIAQAHNLLQKRKVAAAAELVDKELALPGVPGELRQQGYLFKLQMAIAEKKLGDVMAALKLAKEAAPQSEKAKEIGDMIREFSKMGEAKEAAAGLEAGLDKAEGLDRAKLLDKLLDTQQKFAAIDPQADSKNKKWTREIVALDPENKAGLKKKYECKAILIEVQELLRARQGDEAVAALERALEIKDLSGEDAQAVKFVKAQICFAQEDNDQGVTFLKQALAAAPAGHYAPTIKAQLAHFRKMKRQAAREAAGD